MKVVLVTASTFDGSVPEGTGRSLSEDSPLGALSLAACLRAQGHGVVVCDLTQFLRETPGVDHAPEAARWISGHDADVYGFGTICSTYPLTLRLAQEVRRLTRDRPIILGGPQATVTDRLVVQEFPCVDAVVRGEGEYVLPELVRALGAGSGLQGIEGVTYRDGGTVRRNPDAPLIADLDAVPDAAYDLDALLPRRTFVSLELGRGCPFACDFCSTNDFFRRKFRLKSPHRVIAQMLALRARYGHDRFSLVHDMFTVDRRRVVEFCQAMQESGDGLRWSCSARTDCVDPELLELMAESGCAGLFFGIESGSPDQQRRMGKHLDLDEARRVIECAASHGIANTVSLIVGFPEETPEDFSQTVGFMLDAARHDHSEPQLHLLAPLAGTPLALRCRDRIRLDTEIFSDASVSPAGLRADSPEHAMIAAHPDLFINFYLVPTLLPTAYLNEARLFLSRAIRRCRWLIIALDQEAGILDVFDRWRTWRKSLPNAVRYYHDRAFLNDLLAFVEATYYDRGYPATDVIFRYVKELLLHVDDDVPAFESAGSAAHESDLYPVLAPNAQLLSVKGSVPAVIEALKVRRAPAMSDVVRDVRLLVRRTPPQWHEITELPEISGAVLQLCDGSRRVSEIIDAFGESGTTFEGASPEAVCDHTLRYLADARIIEFHASGVVTERHAGLAF